ncbi:hypothetical protein SDC9_93399 [bioreactor metagenome]|uniref:Uncharacterized protein n=1 Tax=bioreactor metagenome TaxID=1076179 RepID=A0A645A757_9ZZZZ
MQKLLAFFTQKSIQDLSKQFGSFFRELPHLPKSARKVLADLLPYFVFVFAIIFLSTFAFALLGLKHFVFRWGVFEPFRLLSWGIDILIALLFLAAFESLRRKEAIGWYALFSTTWLSALKHLFEMAWGLTGWFAGLISLFLSLYLLYELQTEFSLGNTVATRKTAKKTLKSSGKRKAKKK